MCEKCVDALDKYWPDLSKEERDELLWDGTCYPFGSGEQVAAQLKDLQRTRAVD